jgi:hypothetical protein
VNLVHSLKIPDLILCLTLVWLKLLLLAQTFYSSQTLIVPIIFRDTIDADDQTSATFIPIKFLPIFTAETCNPFGRLYSGKTKPW